MKNDSIGKKIKKYRIENGFTQKQLGELLGISQQQIGQYEKDLRQPRLETLDRIASALNKDPWDLYDRYELQSERTEGMLYEISDFEYKIILAFRASSMQDAVLRLLELEEKSDK